MAQLKLYNYFRSSTSYRVRIALNFKKIDYDYLPVHLLKNGGEQHQQAYRNLNPMGGVPCLLHNEVIIGQSMAIIEYLEEAFPDKPLFPSNFESKAIIRQFCEDINSGIHPLGNLQVLQYLEKNYSFNQKQKEEWVQHWLSKGLKAIETNLQKNSDGKFCFYNKLTAADVFLVPQIFTARRFNVDLSHFPICVSVSEHCEKIECFIQAHPKNQPDSE